MMDNMKWIRKPDQVAVENGKIYLVTQPHTDLWQNTYYHFCNDNAPLFLMDCDQPYFSFTVKTYFSDSHHRFDQCGIAIYQDSRNWLKASCEYENESFSNLGSVVTNNGYSDWAVNEIPSTIRSVWYRLSRREDDYRIEYSFDGNQYHMMRIAHLSQGKGTVHVGIYACSPEDSSFTAVFSDLSMDECVWQAHVSQQMDEPQLIISHEPVDYPNIRIITADITDLKVDAIVNAANNGLKEGGGVCGAIFQKAGAAKLRKACDQIGGCPTGEAVITEGFDLKAANIIHAVGPVWQGGSHNEERLLASAYYNALDLGMINGCTSIAFPLISAGIYGYPKQQAWKIALQTCMDFIDDGFAIDITFAVLDEKMQAMGEQIFTSLKRERNL